MVAYLIIVKSTLSTSVIPTHSCESRRHQQVMLIGSFIDEFLDLQPAGDQPG